MTHRKSKAFIILTHTYKPVTHGPDKGKVQVHESCEFVKYVKTRHLQSASVIMDVVKRELIKNAAREKGADYDDIENHMIKGYADKYKLFLEAVGAEIPEALLLSKEEVKEELEKIQVEDDEGNAPQRKQKKIQKELIKKSKEESTTEESE